MVLHGDAVAPIRPFWLVVDVAVRCRQRLLGKCSASQHHVPGVQGADLGFAIPPSRQDIRGVHHWRGLTTLLAAGVVITVQLLVLLVHQLGMTLEHRLRLLLLLLRNAQETRCRKLGLLAGALRSLRLNSAFHQLNVLVHEPALLSLAPVIVSEVVYPLLRLGYGCPRR
jgi:hypothetical protein